ncbi:MAG TPA: hypothetical protein VNX88_12430 [Terriglobales bacterium]|jgi:hypothetical protein|nr:hypothetical protein [Terriglobales bacterium]
MNALPHKLQRWIMSLPDGPMFQTINEHVEHLAEELYCEYEPTKGPYPDFWQRFEDWLDNGDDETKQQSLFRLMPSLFFIGPKELDNLYRVAFNCNITAWLIDQLSLTLDDVALSSKVTEALSHTWFCPLTDSMRINAFYHLNHISGRDHRPDWLSLAVLADPAKVDTFVSSKKIERIVLLEDFVGSGSQIEPAIKFAGSLSSRLPTLIVPLVICPAGVDAARAWETSFNNVQVRPVLELRRLDFLTRAPQTDEPTDHAVFRDLAIDSFSKLLAGKTAQEAKIYGPFGFDDTGGLVILATNCPDNTLPLIHHGSVTWKPLFPRASRI